MHYAVCVQNHCVPWWFQSKTHALLQICIITLCIMRKSTVLEFTKNIMLEMLSTHSWILSHPRPKSSVRRDDNWAKIDVSHIVPGDMISFNIVPADCCLMFQSTKLRVGDHCFLSVLLWPVIWCPLIM